MDIKLGIWKHSKKGTLHRVLGIAAHSETLEKMVVYEELEPNPISQLWVRPAVMWTEEVEIDGEMKPRFVLVSEN